jgi:F-type H+-transporting ATPase subunit b
MFELETGLLFWTDVSFVVLVGLLYFLAFPPLAAMLEKRRQGIVDQLEAAAKTESAAQALHDEYKAKLAKAQESAAEVFESAKQKSQTYHAEAVHRAQAEAQQIIEGAKQDLKMFEHRAITGLKEDIAQVVVEASRRLIGKELAAADQQGLVESAIKDLEVNAGQQI